MDSDTLEELEQKIIRGDIQDFKNQILKLRQDEEELQEYSIFITCIKHKKFNFIKAATQVGLNISQKDYFTGDTLLHFAVAEQETEAVKLLLEIDKNPNPTNEDGNTPFHYACMTGCTLLAQRLYDAGANPVAENGHHMKPLHISIVYGHFYLAAYLLSLDEVLDSLKDQATLNQALKLTCLAGSSQLFFILMDLHENQASNAIDEYSLMHYVCTSGNADIYKYLMNEESEFDFRDNNNQTLEAPLHWAVSNQNRNIVELLVQDYIRAAERVDVKNINGHTPLFLACVRGNQHIIEILKKAKADINSVDKEGDSALHWVASSGSMKTLQYLLSHSDIKVNIQNHLGNTPFYIACVGGRRDMAKLLLQRGASLNATNNAGMTPLHAGCINCDTEVTQLLLAQTAVNKNIRDIKGFQPFHYPIIKNKRHFVAFLTQKMGIYLTNNTFNYNFSKRGVPALSCVDLAVVNGSYETVKYFTERDNNSIHGVNSLGNSLLHLAAMYGYLDIFLYLITKGLELQAKNKDGRTAIDLARRTNNRHILDFLKENFDKLTFTTQ